MHLYGVALVLLTQRIGMANNLLEISRLISNHMFEYGKTSILGLGTFIAEYHSSSFSDDKSSLSPPHYTIRFSENPNGTDQFVDYVSTALNIKPKKAKEKINSFGQNVINDILNFGFASIPGVGELRKNDTDGIDFTFVNDDLANPYYGLPKVNLSPIQYYKSGNQEDKILSQKYVTAIDNTQVVNHDTHTNDSSTVNTSVTDVNQQENIIEPLSYNDESEGLAIGRLLLWILALALLCTLLYKGCSYYNSSNSEIVGSTDIPNNEELVVEVIPEDTLTAQQAEELDSEKSITECVIILGAFESARNAVKMSDKITSLGYVPYEEYFDTMDVTRVGFKFDCSEKDLVQFIKSIRSEITQDAWYLVPRITVD